MAHLTGAYPAGRSFALAPPEERLRRQKTSIFSADSISLTHSSAMEDIFEPARHPEHGDRVARATVYVLNLIIMVFALPVGMALLCLNILGGENLRTTAHVMALTGLFLATCHAVIEDVLIFVVLGGDAIIMLGLRLVLAILLTACLALFWKKTVPEDQEPRTLR